MNERQAFLLFLGVLSKNILTKESLINTLDSFNFLIHNEYFYLYVDLIIANLSTERIVHKTQRHHIVPKHVFEKQNMPVDNSKDNLVDMLYSDHMLSHAYLFLCAKFPYRYANAVALNILCSDAFSLKLLFEILPYAQQQYEETMSNHVNSMCLPGVSKKHSEKMQSSVVRDAISSSIKLVRDKQRDFVTLSKNRECKRVSPDNVEKLLQEGWTLGAPKGKIRMHNFCKETSVWPEFVQEYLNNGWFVGSNPNRIVPTKRTPDEYGNVKHNKKDGWTAEAREQQRSKTATYYKDNLEARRKRSYPVTIENDDTRKDFLSVFECGEFIGLSKSQISGGLVGYYIRLGYINNVNSKFHMWKIYRTNGKSGDANE